MAALVRDGYVEGVVVPPDAPSESRLFAGDYRVVRQLSSGGMATVYLAEQRSTGKERALKVMHPQLVQDAELRERFEREARIVSLIRSDHVVQVIDAGVDEASASPWIAMELLEGEDLESFVARRRRVSVAQLLEVLRQLCHALAAAHAVGVVHRDLKPENIFVTPSLSTEDGARLKVLDFGIAKVLADAGQSTDTLGTPLWMAPEQTDPRALITPATDVWSLGLLAFWMLTGKVFWSSVHTPLVSVQAMMRELLFEPIPAASERAETLGVADALPGGFDAWFAKCVRREPTERYADAAVALAALREALPSTPPEKLSAVGGATAARTMRPVVSGRLTVRDPAASPLAARPMRRIPLSAMVLSGFGVGVVLVAVAAFATGYVRLGSARPDAPETPDATASEVVSPPPIAPSPRHEEVESAGPLATTSVTRTAAPPPSSASHDAVPRPRPFNAPAAQAAVQATAETAKVHCQGKTGPRAVPLTVYFDPRTGGVKRVQVDPEIGSEPSALCAQMVLYGAHVEPFEGPQRGVSAVVGLD